MDYVGITQFLFFTFRVLILNFQIHFSCRLVVAKFFRQFSECHPKTLLYTLSAVLAVATKSQLGSILAWDLDVEQLLLRELESLASDPGDDYFAVRKYTGIMDYSIESHLKSPVVGNNLHGTMARITSRRSFKGCWP